MAFLFNKHFSQHRMNTFVVARTGHFVMMEKNVCLPMSVPIAPLDNVYSLQKKKMQKAFPMQRARVVSCVQVMNLSSKVSKLRAVGQFTKEQVISIKLVNLYRFDVFLPEKDTC